MKVSIGRIVFVKGVSANGTDVQPAIVTRVFQEHDTAGAPVMVNITVFPDCGTPVCKGSVMLFDTRALAIADFEKREAALVSAGHPDDVETYPSAFWPDRA